MNPALLEFAGRLLPHLVNLVAALYTRFHGDHVKAGAEIHRILNHGADFEKRDAAAKAELDALKAASDKAGGKL